MGVLVDGQCFSLQRDANDAFYSQQAATTLPETGGFYEVSFRYNAASNSRWERVTYHYNTSGVYQSSQATEIGHYGGASCDPAGRFIDGTAVGWGIASALILATCIKLMRRAM